jgi:hypothetical protein
MEYRPHIKPYDKVFRKKSAMNMPGKLAISAWASLVAMALTAPAQVISIQDFFNDAIISPQARRFAVILSFSTEEFRYAQAGVNIPRIACIEENFIHDTRANKGDDPPGFNGLIDRLREAKNKSADVEGYIVRSIEAFCPGNGKNFVPVKVPTTDIHFFYKLIPDNVDKVIILNFVLATQGARVYRAGDEARAQCIDGLLVKTADSGQVIPDAFRQDIMRKLAVANASASDIGSMEGVLIDAITKNCGHESG